MATALRFVEDQKMNTLSESAAAIANYYAEQCGMKKLPWMAKEFEKLLKQGFEPDLLKEIIDRTARAARPSWAYLSTIIGKCEYHAAYDLVAFFKMPRKSAYHDPLPY